MLRLWLEVELVNSLDFTWFSVFCEERNTGILVCTCGEAVPLKANLYAMLQSFKKKTEQMFVACVQLFFHIQRKAMNSEPKK